MAGRWQLPTIHKWLKQKCNVGLTDDEKHFDDDNKYDNQNNVSDNNDNSSNKIAMLD